MRLLNAKTKKFHEFFDINVPPYVILSHTWGDEEVTYEDVRWERASYRSKKGWEKIEKCCLQVIEDGLEYVWIDTCCIDKSSSAELQEAINSMFRWYELSFHCYAYIFDFVAKSRPSETHTGPEATKSHLNGLRESRWFTRGWTLQELLAPSSVRFFDSSWSEFGDKVAIRETISSITGIQEEILLASGLSARQAMDSFSVAQKMSWAAGRTTTRPEDVAYCLLGIFDVQMPLLYGEGPKAFQRLQEEIMKASDDQSLLAWGLGEEKPSLWGVSAALARSPSDFVNCSDMASWGAAMPGDSFSMTQRGLELTLPIAASIGDGDLLYCVLNCATKAQTTGAESRVLAVPMLRSLTRADGKKPKVDEYYWLSSRIPVWVNEKVVVTAPRMTVYLPRLFKHGDPTRPRLHSKLQFDSLLEGYFVAGTFPPEISEHEMIDVKLPVSDGEVFVVIHIASSGSSGLPDFIVVVRTQQAHQGVAEKDQNLETEADNATIPIVHRSVSRVFTGLGLNMLVKKVFAEELGYDISELTETADLENLGVDSLMSLAIAARLREEIDVHFGSDLLFGSKTIGDVENKLRFATRPYFRIFAEPSKAKYLLAPQLSFNQYNIGAAALEFEAGTSLLEFLTVQGVLNDLQFTPLSPSGKATFEVGRNMALNIELKADGTKNDIRFSLE